MYQFSRPSQSTGQNGNAVSALISYDGYGNPTSTTDARGIITQVTYGDILPNNGTDESGLYPTQTVAASGTAQATTSLTSYDFSSGLATQTTLLGNNSNENVTSSVDYDALGRPVLAKAAVGTAQEIWTRTVYDDANRRVIAKADLFSKDDGKKVSVQHYDQLGRVRLTRTLEDAATQSATNETDGIKVQTRYLSSGVCTYNSSKNCSFQLTSNPYRATTSSAASTESTMGWTRSQSQADGKHSEVETFSGYALPAPFVSSGANTVSTGVVKTDVDADRTLVTDQAGKQRISQTNALGQLKKVWEIVPSGTADSVSVTFPNQTLSVALETSYNYDTLNNLTTVVQGYGSNQQQQRSFSYSSLSRLTSAANPESGTINYSYDAGGNLLTKTDARLVVTTFTYDNLSRVLTRTYSGEGTAYQTPAVSYTYDDSNVPFSKGKLTKVSSSVSETKYTAFDALGKVLSSQQTTEGKTYPFIYKYTLSGALAEETYPSGRVVRQFYDVDGDLSKVTGYSANQGGLNKQYAGDFSYTSHGAIAAMKLGNNRWETAQFNARLQPVQLGLGTSSTDTSLWKAEYSYGEYNSSNNTIDATKNNGNVARQIITAPHMTSGQPAVVFTQSFTYDSLNRLKQAKELSGSTENWKQTFLYDRFGNSVRWS